MSERDKKLLFLLGFVGILVLGYYLGYAPMVRRQKVLEVEIKDYKAQYDELSIEYDKKDMYLKEIDDALERIDDIQSTLPASLTHDHSFELMFVLEEKFENLRFGSVAFSETEILNYNNENNDDTTLYGMRQQVTTTVDMAYDDLKAFMKEIYAYKYRTVLNNMNFTLDEDEQNIQLAFVANMYGLAGPNRVVEDIRFDEVPNGKRILFDSPNMIWDDLDEVEQRSTDGTADLFISLKPSSADGDAQVMGIAGDATQTSYVTSDRNSAVNSILRIFIENNQYYASYEVDGSYKERQVFDIETTLEVQVKASERLNSNDKAGMNLTIINQTELPAYIVIDDENTVNDRLNVISTDGEVIIEK